MIVWNSTQKGCFLFAMKLTIIIPVFNQEKRVIRALDSIPVRDDVEVIVVDDGSTDGTWLNLRKYQDNTDLNLCLLYNEENEGVASAVNKGLDNASGEYIVLLGSDDYFYKEALNEAIDSDLDADLVYFDLKVNSGRILRVREDTKFDLCGSTKFMRREFVGETRNDTKHKAGEDWYFYHALMDKQPTEHFTGKVIKHYNYPREGSLTWKLINKSL